MNFGQILNTPVITAALITGIVAFIIYRCYNSIYDFFIKYSIETEQTSWVL